VRGGRAESRSGSSSARRPTARSSKLSSGSRALKRFQLVARQAQRV
jgi:hypothetical protein